MTAEDFEEARVSEEERKFGIRLGAKGGKNDDAERC